MATYGVGNIIEFFYVFIKGRRRTPSPTKPGHTGPYKERVLVLNPMYNNFMHGLDMEMLTDAEAEALEAMLDPKQEGQEHRMPIVNDTLKRMKPWEEIKNPSGFYTKLVKPFLHGKDAYRTYNPGLMRDIVVIQRSDIKGNVINPKPLFKAIGTENKEVSGPKDTSYGGGWLNPLGGKTKKNVVQPAKAKISRPKKGRKR